MNIISNKITAFVSGVTASFDSLSIDSTKVSIIRETPSSANGSFKSFNPLNGINSLTGFTKGNRYLVYPKIDFTVTEDGSERVRADALLYNLSSLITMDEGTEFTIMVNEDGTGNNLVEIASFAKGSGDTTAVNFAATILGAIRDQSSTTGYFAYLSSNTVKGDSCLVIARGGLGASLNGKSCMITFDGGSTGANFSHGVN